MAKYKMQGFNLNGNKKNSVQLVGKGRGSTIIYLVSRLHTHVAFSSVTWEWCNVWNKINRERRSEDESNQKTS